MHQDDLANSNILFKNAGLLVILLQLIDVPHRFLTNTFR